MKIDWKRKLSSRKFWAAIASFVTMLLIYYGHGSDAEQIAELIMAGASIIAYIIGEGLADTVKHEDNSHVEWTYTVGGEDDEQAD